MRQKRTPVLWYVLFLLAAVIAGITAADAAERYYFKIVGVGDDGRPIVEVEKVPTTPPVDPEEPTDPVDPVDPMEPEEPVDPDTDGDGTPDNMDPCVEDPEDKCDDEPTDPNQPTEPHAHFEKWAAHPNKVAAWSLREQEHYQLRRGGSFDGPNPQVTYDAELDAAKVSIRPLHNDLYGYGLQYNWKADDWKAGDTIVVFRSWLISQAMHDLIWKKGTNENSAKNHKAFNLTTGPRQSITLETRFFYHGYGDPDTLLDWRFYGTKLEGRNDRDMLASDVPEKNSYERHPGPDSSWQYRENLPHPENFKGICDKWTTEITEWKQTEEGVRIKVWLTNEDTPPKLVVASPIDPSLGFLVDRQEPITGFYVEFDTSQETTYEMPQPERWVGVRDVVVLRNVKGEDVIVGSQPVR